MADIARIEAVYLECAPYVNGPERDEIDAEHSTLSPPFVAAMEAILANQDAAKCWTCKTAVGFVLTENREGHEHLEWLPTALAREDDGPVALLCGECSPYVPYFDSSKPTT